MKKLTGDGSPKVTANVRDISLGYYLFLQLQNKNEKAVIVWNCYLDIGNFVENCS